MNKKLKYSHNFPAIRGIQAGREYYTSMCPLKLVTKLFLFDDEEIRADVRAQRILNEKRIPEIARYIIENPKDYIFSAITVSVNGELEFESVQDNEDIGVLHISMDAEFLINDGQHRRAAIELALKEEPDLADEAISLVIFPDSGLKRSQQMFTDLNKYSIRPSKSINVLYDHRDESSLVAKNIMNNVPIFMNLTEKEKSSISNRSSKIFTLSGIHSATIKLLKGLDEQSVEDKTNIAVNYWKEISKYIPEWQKVSEGKLNPKDLRSEYITGHTLALSALGTLGNYLLKNHKKTWKDKIKKIKTLDWSRNNSKLWEGRALSSGRLSKKNVNVILTSNQIKKHLSLKLTDNDLKYENDFQKGKK